jgi:hypothetical protein
MNTEDMQSLPLVFIEEMEHSATLYFEHIPFLQVNFLQIPSICPR